MNNLLKLEDVAVRLGVSRTAVQNYIKDGRLKAVKVGRSTRIREADLQKFIEGKRTEKELGS